MIRSIHNGVIAARASVVLGLLSACGNPAPVPNDVVLGCSGGTGGEDGVGLAEAPKGDLPTLEEYAAQHVVESDGGWIIEGDIFVSDYALVEQAYRNAVGALVSRPTDFRATAACDPFFAVDSVLDPAQKLMMSYCFTESWDDQPELKALAREGLVEAAQKWEMASDLNFVEVDIEPRACEDSRDDIDFEVRYVKPCTEATLFCYNALATFPYNSSYRSLSLRATTFESPDRADRILTHELGHFLGLWHEHQRYPQDTDTCTLTISDNPEDWRGVTSADPDSVMGYPQCEGTSPQPPHPSTLDLVTVEYLYGLPRSEVLSSNWIIWHHPESADRTMWTRVSPAGTTLQYNSTTACWLDDCEAFGSEFWRPFIVDLDGNASSDVFMYGPGLIGEQVHANVGGPGQTSSAEVLSHENAAVPWIVDDFLGGGTTTIWWQRPGLPQDSLWQFTGADEFAQLPANDLPIHNQFFLVATGNFATSGDLAVYWWSPLQGESYLLRSEDGSIVFDTIYPEACGLVANAYYNRIPGNFDDDPEDELIWFEPRTGTAFIWRSLLHCYQPGQVGVLQWGRGKPLIGRFDADEIDDVLVYRPEGSLVTYFAGATVETWSRSFEDDTSPYVADLDGDGCDDVLWYAPEQSSSRFWRSDCAGNFVEEAPLETPRGYPLGYGSGHGRLPLRSY